MSTEKPSISAGPPTLEGQGPRSRDAAADLLSRSGVSAARPTAVDPAESRRVCRRIDKVILPVMLIVYFLQALDKATLAYASVFGLIEETGLVGSQYSWLGSIVYVSQLVMQPPLAWMLLKMRVGKFSAVMVLLWGATLASMAAAKSFTGLLVGRFFLGAFEAGIGPAFLAITQMWWTRREQTLRTSVWYSTNGTTIMFGSLMTYGLGHIQSAALKPHQIIFIFFGLITIGFSFVAGVFLADSPVEAKFLNDHDKIIAVERLRMNQMGVMSRHWRWDHAKEAFRDPKTWCWFALLTTSSLPSGGISTFGPLIIKSFGFNQFQTILFNIPFGAVACFSVLTGAWVATKYKSKGPIIAFICIFPIIGCLVMLVIPHEGANAKVLLGGYYIASMYPGISPLIYAWETQNTGGDTKQKCVTAIMFVGQCVGNIIGALLYKPEDAPQYTLGLASNLAFFAFLVVLVALTTLVLRYQNRSHSRRRVALGKSAVIADPSMVKAEQAHEQEKQQLEDGGGDEDIGAKAFDDLTDLQNEDFIFLY